jgi:precorrin-6A synthase (deacetylating)
VRRVLVIGIGAGDPDHLTVQAINALNQVDVFFVMDKGADTHDLIRLRQQICERFVEHPTYRIVQAPDPPRDRTAAAYGQAVEAWRQQRAELWGRMLGEELGDGDCGGFLVWGDPSLYDSTIDVLERILAEGSLEFEYEVVPGISSVQALAASHRIALNRVGGPVHITPAAGWPTASPSTARHEVRERAGAGMPVVAECAGLLWLGASLDGHDQCGVLSARARMTGTLHLGYREATALHNTPLVSAGTRVRAHEFHRTVSDPVCGDRPAWELADGTRQGWAGPNLLASYLHLHWAGVPGAATRLVSSAVAARMARV